MKATREYLSTMSKILNSVSENDSLDFDMITNTNNRFDSFSRLLYVNFIKDSVLSALENSELGLDCYDANMFTVYVPFGTQCRHYEITAYTFNGEISMSAYTCDLEYSKLRNVGFISEEEFNGYKNNPREFSNSRNITKLLQKIEEDRKKLAKPVDDVAKEYRMVITEYEYILTNLWQRQYFKKMELFKIDGSEEPIDTAYNQKAKDYRNTRLNIEGKRSCAVKEEDPHIFKSYIQFLKKHGINKNIVDVRYESFYLGNKE